MFTNFGLSNMVLVGSAIVAGLIVGALCVGALHRAGKIVPPAPQWNMLSYGGGMLLGGGLLGGCMLLFGGGAPAFVPPTMFSPSATPTLLIQTVTPTLPPKPAVTDIPVPTATATPRPLPSPFDITLLASDEKLCQKKNFQAPYRVTIQGTAMTLLQVDANIASVGTYNATTGAFTTTKTGLPGTEIYTGTLTYEGTTIKVLGTYTYTNDPNVKCVGLWVISGQKVVP